MKVSKLHNNPLFNYCHKNIHNEIIFYINSSKSYYILYNKSSVQHQVVVLNGRHLLTYLFLPLCHVACCQYIKIINIVALS
jgi:hypothetical protein